MTLSWSVLHIASIDFPNPWKAQNVTSMMLPEASGLENRSTEVAVARHWSPTWWKVAPSPWADSPPACLCSEAVWPTCPTCLVWVIKVEKKFHSGLFNSTFSFWWHPKDWGGFWAGFSAWLQVQESSTCWALQSQWGLTCNLGRIGVFVAREGKSVTLFLFQSRKDCSRCEVWCQLQILSWVEDLQASLRSVSISWISIFLCGVTFSLHGIMICNSASACEVPSWNHIAHRRQNLPMLLEMLTSMWDSGFQSTLRTSVLVAPCVIHVRAIVKPHCQLREGGKEIKNHSLSYCWRQDWNSAFPGQITTLHFSLSWYN